MTKKFEPLAAPVGSRSRWLALMAGVVMGVTAVSGTAQAQAPAAATGATQSRLPTTSPTWSGRSRCIRTTWSRSSCRPRPIRCSSCRRIAFSTSARPTPSSPIDDKWDDAVKSLLNYPDVVKMMSADLDWTSALGEAVVADQGAVLDAVQSFRRKAQAAGNLKSDGKQVVAVEKEIITIVPADPQVIYVPQYNPTTVVVYGVRRSGATTRRPTRRTTTPIAPGAALAAGVIWGAAIGAAWSGGHYGANYGGNANININRNTNINTGNINTRQRQPRRRRGPGRRHAPGSPTSSPARSAARSARPAPSARAGRCARRRWRRRFGGRRRRRGRRRSPAAAGGARRCGARRTSAQPRAAVGGGAPSAQLRRLGAADPDGQLTRRVEPQFGVEHGCASVAELQRWRSRGGERAFDAGGGGGGARRWRRWWRARRRWRPSLMAGASS